MAKDWTRNELEKHYVGKMKAITLPVNISITGQQKVLSLKELEEILRNAKVISQNECSCRSKFGHCIEPMDGCISIDEVALEDIEKYGDKQITVDEALAAFKRTYDAGLVHMVYIFEGQDKIGRICSCCSCCCHSLSAAIRFGYDDHVFSSKYIATQDNDKCMSCGMCAERCQFGARELVGEELEYSEKKCFGCGLCIETCSNDAIELVEREE
jgi:ferredoxin